MLKGKSFQALLDCSVASFSFEPEVMTLGSCSGSLNPCIISDLSYACVVVSTQSLIFFGWEGISACAVSEPCSAALKLFMRVTGCWSACHHERQASLENSLVTGMCDLAFWCPATLCIPHKHFSKFSSILKFWRIWVLLGVPVNRVLLAYVRVLNDWNENFLLKASSLPLIVLGFGFLAIFGGVFFVCGFVFFFVNSVLGTVRCIVPFCPSTASHLLLEGVMSEEQQDWPAFLEWDSVFFFRLCRFKWR